MSTWGKWMGKNLLWTLNDLLDIANGCSANINGEFDDNFVNGFDHKLSFRQLYDFIKQNKEYVFNKNIPHATCLCEICENAVFFMKGINNQLKKYFPNLPTNPHDSVERFSCDSASEDCMNSKCLECQSSQGSDIIGDFCSSGISFDEWKKVDNRIQKVSVSISSSEEIMSLFNDHVKVLKKHIHVKRIQNAKFNSLKKDLQGNEVIIQVDYSENYTNKDQGQIQSAYFGQQGFSIFTACCYLNVDGVVVNENVTVTSEANDHSRIAALSCWLKVLALLQEKHPLQKPLILHIWSDGCAGQFRSRFVFSLLSQFATILVLQ